MLENKESDDVGLKRHSDCIPRVQVNIIAIHLRLRYCVTVQNKRLVNGISSESCELLGEASSDDSQSTLVGEEELPCTCTAAASCCLQHTGRSSFAQEIQRRVQTCLNISEVMKSEMSLVNRGLQASESRTHQNSLHHSVSDIIDLEKR